MEEGEGERGVGGKKTGPPWADDPSPYSRLRNKGRDWLTAADAALDIQHYDEELFHSNNVKQEAAETGGE